MSPILHKIRGLRKLREKYNKLRDRAITEKPTTIEADRTREWVLGSDELKAVAKGVADRTIMQSIEKSDWGDNYSDWQMTATTEPDSTDLGVYGHQNDELEQKDKGEVRKAVKEVLSGFASEEEEDFTKMMESFDEEMRDREEIADAALGDGVELSDLLKLEEEQPDDFSTLEAPTRPTSPKEDDVSSTSDKMSFDFDYFGWDDEDDEDIDEFPATDFSRTEATMTDAEWALRSLLPFKRYRAKAPTLLRACCTINN